MDTGVLIAAWRGDEPAKTIANALLEDESRHLIASPFLKLELIPKARNTGRHDEARFYEYVFSLVSEWVSPNTELVDRAIEIGILYQVTKLDMVHAASAESVGVEQFVTSELPPKPYYSVPKLKAVNLLMCKQANGAPYV